MALCVMLTEKLFDITVYTRNINYPLAYPITLRFTYERRYYIESGVKLMKIIKKCTDIPKWNLITITIIKNNIPYIP